MNMKLARAATLALVGALALSACDTMAERKNPVTSIVSTTSFGMCMGYCRTRLEITQTQVVLIREPGGRGAPNLPVQRFSRQLASGEWLQLQAAAASAQFAGLPETIGCPDCADGGAESLVVNSTDGEKTVTFDHGADIRELQPLLTRVREIRTSLTPKE